MLQNDNREMNESDDRRERQRCKRSRKKKFVFFYGRKIMALCLGAAILGGVCTGIYQRNNCPAAERPDSIISIPEEMSWSGDLTESNLSEAGLQDMAFSDHTSLQDVSTSSLGRVYGGMDVSDIAASALPSVVSITNISVQEVQRFYDRFGRNGQGPSAVQETTSCGSGVIIARTGSALYMVTNYHVVEGAVTLSVTFADDTVCKAELCGTDENLDLAVIQVSLSTLSADTLNQISVVSVGDSGSLRVGEQVVAIGNALGYGQSVTTGIISALNRTITTGVDAGGNAVSSTYIQTDAAINPGNSGGALLNMNGELIGINTAKAASAEIEGMGYAIPISNVWSAIQSLMV